MNSHIFNTLNTISSVQIINLSSIEENLKIDSSHPEGTSQDEKIMLACLDLFKACKQNFLDISQQIKWINFQSPKKFGDAEKSLHDFESGYKTLHVFLASSIARNIVSDQKDQIAELNLYFEETKNDIKRVRALSVVNSELEKLLKENTSFTAL